MIITWVTILAKTQLKEDLEDTGYDATAVTAKEKKYGKKLPKLAFQGSSVYVQIKGSLKPSKRTHNKRRF